jgi:hypothetical protein
MEVFGIYGWGGGDKLILALPKKSPGSGSVPKIKVVPKYASFASPYFSLVCIVNLYDITGLAH